MTSNAYLIMSVNECNNSEKDQIIKSVEDIERPESKA